MPLILYGCSEPPDGSVVYGSSVEEDNVIDESFATSAINFQFENIGNSYVLLNCADASAQISSNGPSPQVELGMSAAEIRSIVGKPRHIYEGVWTFGYDQPVNLVLNPLWDLIPTTTVPFAVGTTAFSGDNTGCNFNTPAESGIELKFISEANDLINIPDTESHRNEVPECKLAAKRIAAKVELGMTPDQVRDLVGKPVEITPEGLWRYKYGPDPQRLCDTPAVQFGDASLLGSTSGFGDQFFGDTEETGINNVRVLGYWSPVEVCSIEGSLKCDL